MNILFIYFNYFILFVAGNFVLHTSMALEKLGGWEDPCAYDGLGHRNLLRNREEAKEEIDD